MNKNNEMRHKCGYCGWLFNCTTNFLQHECFKHYVEGEDRINIDENYVVTIYSTKTTERSTSKDTIDELLIEAVKNRKGLYDYRIPASERSNLRKNALWAEISNNLGGALSPEEAKARWKYLRDNYTKARKKFMSYVPSGSAAKAGGVKKVKFRFYDLMAFLNDFLETRQTVSSLPNDVTENEVCETFEQYEDDVIALSPGSSDISSQTSITINTSPMLTPTDLRTPTTFVPLQISTPDNVLPQTLPRALNVTSRIPATNLKRSLQTANLNVPGKSSVTKNPKNDALQTALMEALKEPTVETIDPLDGFLTRLGEGMRRLSYRERARLEIRFLTLLSETEELYGNQD